MGNLLVLMMFVILKYSKVTGTATDTQAFIARDDTRKEIVVALRGRSAIHPIQLPQR